MSSKDMKRRNTKNKKRKKKRKAGRIIRNIILIIIIAIAAVIIGGLLLFSHKYGTSVFECAKDAKQLVAESTEEDFMPNSASFIYSDNGTEIAKLYEDTESTYLTFDEIPKDVRNAFVAVEDRTFWENSGIDAKGIVRVTLNYIKTKGGTAHGASTITQQLARDVFLTNEKSLERKVKEIFIALELTKKYDKKQILEYYCNNCCFANGIFGIEDASETYFDKPASELTLSEAAYLCAIPNWPEYYNPLKDSSNAITRRDKILEDMYECDFISNAEMTEAKAEEITIAEQEEETEFYNYETTFAINSATEYLMKELYDFDFQYEFNTEEEYEEYHKSYNETYQNAKHRLYTGGYEIQTSINLGAQKKLQEILNEQLAFNTQLKEGSDVYNLQGAITAIDNETGKVIAAVGGREQEELQQTYSYNRAYQGYRQPGSTMKPILVYTPALMKEYTANSQLKDIDVKAAKTSTSEKISQMTGSSYSLRNAVENSRNGCAYSLYNELTPSYGMPFLYEMEFSNLDSRDLTLSAALGGLTHGATTTEMANAYSTLANHGQFRKADCIVSILDKDGNEMYSDPEVKQVYSEEAADQMVDIMKGVITRGTAKGINWYSSTDTEAAGKTGTTNDNTNGWFCGITPQYTIAVWIGNDDNSKVAGLSGNSYPLKIWKEAMLYLIDGKPAQTFDLNVASKYSSDTTTEDESDEPEEEEPEETQEPEDIQGNVPTQDPTTSTTPEENIQGTVPDDIQGNIGDGSTTPDNNNDNNGDSSAGQPGAGDSDGGSGDAAGGTQTPDAPAAP